MSAEPIRRSRTVSNNGDELSDMFDSPHPESLRCVDDAVSSYGGPVENEPDENTNSLNSDGVPIVDSQNDLNYDNVSVNDDLLNTLRRYGYINSDSINSYYDTTLRQLYNDLITRRRR